MPIKPENKHHYTKAAGWPEIRRQILDRATLPPVGDMPHTVACELCCVPNGRVVWRQPDGPQWTVRERTGWRPVRIVLTIAHINQDPTDNRLVNLLALCQRCHNKIDAPYRQRNAAATRAAKAARAASAVESITTTIPRDFSDEITTHKG